MTTKLYRAGDVRVEVCGIRTLSGIHQDIIPQVREITIYESITSPFITGTVTIEDAQDLINKLPIIGQEFLLLKISTPTIGDDYIYEEEFFINKVSEKELIAERTTKYTLSFMSKESIRDVNVILSKPFEGKISEVVREICQIGLSIEDSFLNIEETGNKIKFVPNIWSPLRCIDYVKKRAENQNGSSSYLFFRNKFGFNFVSTDSLFRLESYTKFSWNQHSANFQPNSSSMRDILKDYEQITKYQTPSMTDYFQNTRGGLYGSLLMNYDVLTRQFSMNFHNPQESKTAVLNTYSFADGEAGIPTALRFRTNTVWGVHDGYSDISAIKYIQGRNQDICILNVQKVFIEVFGRTDYSVGQIVDVTLPKITNIQRDDSNVKDVQFSGRYLISHIKHKIEKQKHTCEMQLVKDSIIDEAYS